MKDLHERHKASPKEDPGNMLPEPSIPDVFGNSALTAQEIDAKVNI